MNGRRPHRVTLPVLPARLTLSGLFSGRNPPLHAELSALGDARCLARLAVEEDDCTLGVLLPDTLAKHGPGRYLVRVMDACRVPCGEIEVCLEASCEVHSVDVDYPENCHV